MNTFMYILFLFIVAFVVYDKTTNCRHIHSTPWAQLVGKWYDICGSSNFVKKRSDGVGMNMTDAGEWSLHKDMDKINLPICKNAEELLLGLRLGQRPNIKLPHYRTADFIPVKCKPTWIDEKEACNIAGRYSRITFIGDSLGRHWVQGIQMMLKGDFAMGGLPLARDYVKRKIHCRCDGQFSEHTDCRIGFEDTMVDYSWNHGICYRADAFFIKCYPMTGEQDISRAISDMCVEDNRNQILVIQGGAHIRSNASATIERFIDPVFKQVKDIIKSCKHKLRISVIWSGLNAQNHKLDLKYPHQTISKAIDFNYITDKHVSDKYNITSMNFINMTTNASVSDGYHYLSEVNILKAMYFLNLISYNLSTFN